jgi:hypothetical protein
MRYLLILVVFVSACAPTYVPNVRNVPLFSEGGEFQGTVYVTTGIEAQLAYAVSDNVALMGNYSRLKEKNTAQGFTRENNYYEGGLGYFKNTRSRRFELFGGYGIGNGTGLGQYNFFFSTFGQQELVTDYNYSRIFIQPSIGTNNRKFNIAFTTRFSLVDFSKFTASTATIAATTVKPNENPHLFIEPSLSGKFPLVGNLNGVFQLGLNVAMPSDVYFTFVPVQVAFGIQLQLGDRLRTRVY